MTGLPHQTWVVESLWLVFWAAVAFPPENQEVITGTENTQLLSPAGRLSIWAGTPCQAELWHSVEFLLGFLFKPHPTSSQGSIPSTEGWP